MRGINAAISAHVSRPFHIVGPGAVEVGNNALFYLCRVALGPGYPCVHRLAGEAEWVAWCCLTSKSAVDAEQAQHKEE